MWIFVISFLIWTTIRMIFEFGEMMVVAYISVFALDLVIIAVVWKQFPRINDNFYIKQELKATVVLSISIVIAWIPIIVIDFATNIDSRYLELFDNARYVYLLGLMYICVEFVINQNNIYNNSNKAWSNKKDFLTLANILGNMDCFQIFMDFMVRYVD